MFENLGYEESKTKQNKRVEILNHALDLFIRDGIHNVTMQQIASVCDISIRSLYYYYPNKEELAVDIQVNVFSGEWLINDNLDIDNMTAYDVIKATMLELLKFMNENHKIVKFIAAFDFYFYNSYPGTKYLDHLEIVQNNIIFNEIVKKAEEDGSVEDFGKGHLVAFATMFHSIMAYAQRIIYREKAMMLEESGNKGDLELFVDYLLKAYKK